MYYKFFCERTRRKDYTPRLEESAYFVVKHLHKFIISSVHRYVRANSTVVDIGCGEQPMKTLIEEKGGQYIGVDIAQNSQNNVDIVCSATSIELPDSSVDCILCTEVVEHVPEIDKVFREFARILKPNGYIILTCPFLYSLHEEPHDFQRPTPYLLEFLANKYFLTVLQLEKTGNAIECIAPIDADDIWYPTNLEKQVQCMLQTNSSVGLVYAWSAHIDEKSLPTGNGRTSRIEGDAYIELVQDNFVGNASACLIRRVCFERVGGYNSNLKEQNAEGCADWDLYLRIAECYEFRVVPEFLIGYRQLVSSSMSYNYQGMVKSYSLVMADAQQRNPQISANIYRSSARNFYVYLSYQTRRQGNHWNTFYWLYKALELDPTNILKNSQLWQHAFTSFLKLIAQPVTSLIWPNPSTWGQFKRRLISQPIGNAPDK